MKLMVDRDSICAGDDSRSHVVSLDIPDDATLEQALTALAATRYHHVNAGGPTTWLVRTADRIGRPLAAMRLADIAYIAAPHTPLADLTDRLHLSLDTSDTPAEACSRISARTP